MSVIVSQGAVDSQYQRHASDDVYDGPVDMSMMNEGPLQTYPGCFGLPYQDHNYGALPPATPPQSPPLVATPIKEPEVQEDIIVTADVTPSNVLKPASPPSIDNTLDQDDPTRCICDFIHDDGYMIQCDKCSVWQHIACMGLDRDSIPDVYFCEECKPRPVDRARAKKFQIQKREFLKSLVIKSHDSSTDTDPEEVNNRLKAYGLDQSNSANNKPKQKMKLKKRKERTNSRTAKRLKSKELKIEKENTSNEANRKNKLLVKDFSTKSAQQRKEKLSKKIERMRAERLSKEMVEDKLSSDDLRDDDKLINTISSPMVHDENAQNPWNIAAFNEWEQNYESARYNQYTTYVQEYLNSSCINGHHNDIADLVTDGLRVQRCHVKNLKNKKKGLEASCAIPNSQPIIEVIGKVMTKQQYDKDNYGQRQLSPFVFFYGNVFELDLVIDASDYGNDARFIRRSCQPNATVRHVVAGGQAHFITVATKEIPENAEITIPFDYDYKKWNFCVECACLRNNCPVTRYQKRRLRFQKIQNGDTSPRKSSKYNQVPKLTIKSPTKSPTKSPISSPPVKSPEKEPMLSSPSPDTIHVNPPTTSTTKMLRRSQVNKGSSQSAKISCSAKVPSQTTEKSSVSESISVSTPTVRSAEVDSSISAKNGEESNTTRDSTDTPRSEEKRKMTREERKMEAIMKAFEKMEKRIARKASVDHQHKGKDQKEPIVKEKVKEEKDIKTEVKKEKALPNVVEELVKEEEVEVKEEKIVNKIASPEASPVKVAPASTVDVKVEVKEEEMEVETTTEDKPDTEKPLFPVDKPQPTVDRPQTAKGKKAKKTGGRRRTRNCSGAGSTDTPVESQEENSNGVPAIPQTISCPTTPAPIPITDTNDSDTPPSFKFVKTKRHLMNEWLTEKKEEVNSKPVRAEPLEVTVEENMFVTCLPSPRNSMDRLRRNSQTAGVRERSASLQCENNTGSAKKRWLRQAMGEECETTAMATSPIPGSGGQSPNHHITVQLHSPDGSPPVDFVTPLKKRRLARESLSHDSTPGESPAQTPISFSSITASTSYFSSLTESFETFKARNGINSFFSPVKAEVTESNQEEAMEILSEEVHSNVANTDEISCTEASAIVSTCEPSVTNDGDNSKDSVSSCSEDVIAPDKPDSGQTGTCTEQTNVVQISNSVDKSSSDSVDNEEVLTTCEQNDECDQPSKSATTNNTLEPDSSDNVCLNGDNVEEIECDSGVSEEPAQSSVGESEQLVTPSEVDSTECESSRQSYNSKLVSSAEQSSSHGDNNQCDSCNSESRDCVEPLGQSAASQVDSVEPSCSSATPGPSLEDKLCISSSSLHPTSIHLNNVPTHPSSLQTLDKLSHVDSSTDKPPLLSQINSANSVSGSLLEHSAITNSTINHSIVDNSFRSVLDNEVSNSVNLASIQSNFTVPLKAVGETYSVTSNTGNSVDVAPTQNRHLKFLNDSNYSMDMTVDSTTLPGVGASNLLHSGFPSASSLNYDSDSMDVTSASEPSYGLGPDDGRRLSDESLHSFPDALSSSSNDCQPPKERKKVSLQEYLKRKKVKPSTMTTSSTSVPVPPVSATPGPSRSSVSSTTTTSPLKLSTLITLDKIDKKIQPLPSLPSLPMFEKTERKEFKSSSDLLSPIFNRKEKQEEVRKPMSLSERLRQEFGLDDTVNDSETESKTAGGSSKTADAPPPPPPPPPQPMSRSARISSDSGASPVMKPINNSLLKGGAAGDSGLGLLGGVSHKHPPPSTSKLITPSSGLSNSKSPLQSASIGNMLASIKLPQPMNIDLKAQLAALKAQISKVQQFTSSSSSCTASLDQSANGQLPASATLPQVFDYGHQSSAIFSRQNSCPASTNDNQSASVSSSKAKYLNYNMKTPPQANSSGFNNSANCVSQNGSSNLHEKNSSSVWIYKSSTNGGNGKNKFSSSGRKHFEKQFSNKY